MEVGNLFDVKGKVVLVTGGAKGIGLMISTGFVTNGAKVYISSRDAKACTTAASDLTAIGNASGNGGTAHALPADLQSYEEVKKLASELSSREPKLHVLVNNSGATWGDAYDTFPDHAWTKILTLNLQRVFTLTQHLTPLLEAAASPQDPARVINIGSIDGLRVPTLANFSYSASKAGLHHLSRALARELGPRNITANTIACGPFETKMMAATLRSFRDEIVSSVPLGRIGSPEDVAGTCIFLSSRAGSFVNGATLTLDGGVVLVSKM